MRLTPILAAVSEMVFGSGGEGGGDGDRVGGGGDGDRVGGSGDGDRVAGGEGGGEGGGKDGGEGEGGGAAGKGEGGGAAAALPQFLLPWTASPKPAKKSPACAGAVAVTGAVVGASPRALLAAAAARESSISKRRRSPSHAWCPSESSALTAPSSRSSAETRVRIASLSVCASSFSSRRHRVTSRSRRSLVVLSASSCFLSALASLMVFDDAPFSLASSSSAATSSSSAATSSSSAATSSACT